MVEEGKSGDSKGSVNWGTIVGIGTALTAWTIADPLFFEDGIYSPYDVIQGIGLFNGDEEVRKDPEEAIDSGAKASQTDNPPSDANESKGLTTAQWRNSQLYTSLTDDPQATKGIYETEDGRKYMEVSNIDMDGDGQRDDKMRLYLPGTKDGSGKGTLEILIDNGGDSMKVIDFRTDIGPSNNVTITDYGKDGDLDIITRDGTNATLYEQNDKGSEKYTVAKLDHKDN